MVKHRAENLTHSDALTKFEKDPRIETMIAVRGALLKLKELYVLQNISECDFLLYIF